jgi:hypothetical protein
VGTEAVIGAGMAKAYSRRLVNERAEHYPEMVGQRDVYLGSISALDVPAAIVLPLCARAGRTMWVTWCDLLVYSLVPSSATDYWGFTLRRYRPTRIPPDTAAVITPTDIAVNFSTSTPPFGGSGMGALQTWPMHYRSWLKTNATLEEDDHLALRIEAFGSPPTLDRLMVTWGYTEVAS